MTLTSQAPTTVEEKRARLAARLRQAADKIPAKPLSFAQQRLWFLEQLEPNSSIYNVPVLVRLTGALDVVALEQCLDTIIARHEALRTRFIWLDDAPAQVIDTQGIVKIETIDLTTIQGPQDVEARRIVSQEAARPFDLTADRLLRATLLRLKTDEHLLLVVMHHIVSDEWSLKIFFRELSALYAGFVQGQALRLPELAIQYQDYALWQREWLQGPVLEKQLNYWKEQLRELPPVLELLPDHPRQAGSSFRGASLSRALPRELSDRLKQFANQADATLFMILLAGLNALLNRYTQQEDIVIGSPIAGRERGGN